MDGMDAYHVPMVLTVFAGIFLICGAIGFLVVCVDMIWRRGWRSMMGIMIPVWPINAAYLGPLSLILYFKYGRPSMPSPSGGGHDHSAMQHDHDHSKMQHDQGDMHNHHNHADVEQTHPSAHDHSHHEAQGHAAMGHDHAAMGHDHSGSEKQQNAMKSDPEKSHDMSEPDHSHMHHMHHDMGADRPMWVTVFIGVFHCGAGCVLGDIVGEWLVYGTGAQINGQGIWVELLVDYAFALLFGIVFQYFSIAPMSGDYGVHSLVRSVKADILSLTSFELGLFGWMVASQVGMWNYRLEMTTYTYWWMMQVGMFLGFGTAVPVNWWLIKNKIKEPCA